MYQRIRNVSVLIVLLVTAAGCGNEATRIPSPTPQQTPLIDLSTPTAAPAEEPTVDNSPVALSGDPPASPVPGQRTVGDIADQMGVAWTGVISYRVTSVNQSVALATPVSGATPLADLPSVIVVDEFLLPSRRHRTQTQAGQVTLELIVVDRAIYARGASIPGLMPMADPAVWRPIGPDLLDPASPFSEMYGALLQPVTAPYSGLSGEERERIARPAGTIVVDGLACDVFETADTTVIGEKVTIRIAIGDDDLPCSIETHVASTFNVSTFEYNVPLTITAPVEQS